MIKKRFVSLALAGLAIASPSVSYADESEGGKNLIYFGGGTADNGNALKSSVAPATLGFLRISNTSNAILGFDLSGEGTMLESNGTRTSVKQGTSYNFLFGTNLNKSENTRVDAAFLVGARQTSSTCPTSYLGYQCYANEPPKTSYGLNYGAVVAMTFGRVMLGVRATGESAQALIGFRF